MKNWILSVFVIFPMLGNTQSDGGSFAIGTQFYQNLNLPNWHDGFGGGLNWQFNFYKGLGIDASYIFETNELVNAGSLKRFQRGLAINYAPLYDKKLSPWIQLGAVFNTLTLEPVSYLFSDKSDEVMEQNYFGLTIGAGGRYKISQNASINLGLYYQPQNYNPNYELIEVDGFAILNTNSILLTQREVKPIVYFNIGFTYQILKLW
ncbi:MAG: hypothetical protein AB8B74_15120 [Crocinitomicaceae bacterium]